MRQIVFILITAVMFSCNSNNSTEKINGQKLNTNEELATNKNENYDLLDSTIKDDIIKLDTIYSSSPFYFKIDNEKYFIVCNDKWNYNDESFNGKLKFGLVDGKLNKVLKTEYDKIYNPNITLKDCSEIKKGSKIGLYCFKKNEILAPQFDYIIPSSKSERTKAYGIKNGDCFEINSNNITQLKQLDGIPLEAIKYFDFNVDSEINNMMFNSYFIHYDGDIIEGNGVIVIPSYLEVFKVFSKDHFVDVIMPNQKVDDAFGMVNIKAQIDHKQTLYDKIMAFFVNVYEEGIDGRGYTIDSKDLIVYNTDRNKVDFVKLVELHNNDIFCREANYQFLNDSILEVKSTKELDELYYFETSYTYFKVTKQGKILSLESNRHFDFTKYTLINEKYFEGCFAYYIDNPTDEYNMFQLSHLTIEDLDIMRNEIFAEYGYIFKTDKWNAYFNNKSWYKPKFDNVDDQLTDIDKANINLILQVKKNMYGREDEVIHKTKTTYFAAG